jgi:hypothetical protein
VGCADHRLPGYHDLLGIGAVGAVGEHDRHHVVTDAQVRVGTRADLVHDAGGLHAGHERRPGIRGLGGSAALEGVDGVDGRGAHLYAHLPRARIRDRQLKDLRHLGATEFRETYSLHAKHLVV